jgi:hypothetical protein
LVFITGRISKPCPYTTPIEAAAAVDRDGQLQ